MQRLFAIATLTWKAAFRFRLFWVLAGLLLLSVVVLPLLLKDDGTARGFTQILLTYTLSLITTLLGFSTLWLACGTMARDIEDCQMQMVAVKPITRWQIWLGKWLGLMLLNAALLAVAGASVYALLQWRATKLPPVQQSILHNEIFVARASIKEPIPDVEKAVQNIFARRLKESAVPPEDYRDLKKIIREQLKAPAQNVGTGQRRRWSFDLGVRRYALQDQPLCVRFKFHVAQTNQIGLYEGVWQIGPPEKQQATSYPKTFAAETFHEIKIPPNLWDDQGTLTLDFVNINPNTLIFPLDEGLEVLYRDGGFGLNFARGLGLIFCWLALLAALGLSAASLMSFPVAAFVSASLLVVVLSSGTLSGVVEQGGLTEANHETGEIHRSLLDAVMIPFYAALLQVVNLVEGFSPIDSLSTGRSITWGQLGQAWALMVFLLGGIIGGIGMIILTRRELATAAGKT